MATTATTPRSLRNFKVSQPPTSALPALPQSLNKKSSVTSLRKSSLLPSSPRRIPSSSSLKRPPSIVAHPATPSLLDSPMSPRRSISINSFPNPPQRNMGGRVASLPPSPLNTPKAGNASPMGSPVRSTRTASHQLKRPSVSNMTARYSRDRDSGVAFLSGTSTTGSDHLSPPASRSSSAQDSYSSAATTVDADEKRGRIGGDERADKEVKGNVIISVRVRPDGPEDGKNPDWLVDSRSGMVGYRGKDGGTYDLDNVFSQNDGNTQVYDSCAKRLVRRVMEGYHGTVFAYGMTGTGKTFSMQGTTSQPGVIPLAITDIFAFIRETPHREFLLRVSYLEIYNERIHDLLATQPGSTGFVPLDMQTKGEEIKLREDPKRGVYATPLKEEIVQSPTQLLKVIARGDLCRRTGSTQYNARSSRSHAVVQIVVESRDRVAGATMADNRRNGEASGVRTSTLSLIDLAGSERAAENKERRQEGAHINRSLLTLGTVIARLSKDGVSDKDGNHLPYRDSKLTRLLQPALAGNSLISILCTIAIPQGTSGPAAAINIGETINTLKFAARAKNNITSQAKKSDDNILDAASKALLERYKAEIQELRAALEDTRRKDDEVNQEKFLAELEEKASERHGEQLVEMQLARAALKDRIEHLNRLIITSKSDSPRNSINPQRHSSSASSVSSSSSSSRAARISARTSALVPSGVGYAALQSDLADKTRYIATLEKRLLHARRNSQSRTSITIAGSPHKTVHPEFIVPDAGMVVLLREKDEEIAELRARLDDKERMVAALRSAARKRDCAEHGDGRRSTINNITTLVEREGTF